MRFVAIETSSRRGGVALFSEGDCLRESFFHEGLHHGLELTVHIQNMLKELDLKPDSLEAVAVSLGPGSFTGIRVGVTAAKSLALALGIPVVTESSLRVTAGNALEMAGEGRGSPDAGGSCSEDASRRATHVVPIVSGRQGLFFAGLYEIQERERSAGMSREPDLLLASRVADRLGMARDFLQAFGEGGLGVGGKSAARVLVVGDGADLFLDDARAALGAAGDCGGDRAAWLDLLPLLSRGPAGWDYPRARILGLLTASRISVASFDAEAIHSLEPLYLRVSYAESRLKAEVTRGRDLP